MGTSYLLRGYVKCLEGRTGFKGIVRYLYQGGGQEHTGQLIVSCNNMIIKEINNSAILNHILLIIEAWEMYTTTTQSSQGTYHRTHTDRGRWRSWGNRRTASNYFMNILCVLNILAKSTYIYTYKLREYSILFIQSYIDTHRERRLKNMCTQEDYE